MDPRHYKSGLKEEGGLFPAFSAIQLFRERGSRQSAITLSGSADVKTLARKNILQDIH